MNLLVCVDDTDDLTKSISTGAIVQKIAKEYQALGAKMDEGISRHQLLLSAQVEYTSHNSSMCASFALDGVSKDELIRIAEDIINEFKAGPADPGLAFCWLDELEHPLELIEYGFKAKQVVITKDEAYAFAERDKGLFLEELGGTGIGVIGALAGLGLRLSRCDGTIRGKTGAKIAGETFSATDMMLQIKVKAILDEHGHIIPDDAQTYVADMVKRSYWDGRLVAWSKLCKDGRYELCGNHEVTEEYIFAQGSDCEFFEWDNDDEEMKDTNHRSCVNCLYRRWLAEGYRCVKEISPFED